MLTHHDISLKLRSILAETLNAEPGPDADLIAGGLLDSLTLVSLLLRLEEEFRIRIDMEALDLAAFRTPASIGAVIYGKLEDPGGAAVRAAGDPGGEALLPSGEDRARAG